MLRALVEVEESAATAAAVSEVVPAGIPQLWHGFDGLTWEVIATGAQRGLMLQIGSRTCWRCRNGSAAANNAELVATAVELIGN